MSGSAIRSLDRDISTEEDSSCDEFDSGIDRQSDDSSGTVAEGLRKRRKADPKATRRSARNSSARQVNYDSTHHPQDAYLSAIISPRKSQGRKKRARAAVPSNDASAISINDTDDDDGDRLEDEDADCQTQQSENFLTGKSITGGLFLHRLDTNQVDVAQEPISETDHVCAADDAVNLTLFQGEDEGLNEGQASKSSDTMTGDKGPVELETAKAAAVRRGSIQGDRDHCSSQQSEESEAEVRIRGYRNGDYRVQGPNGTTSLSNNIIDASQSQTIDPVMLTKPSSGPQD